MKNLIAIAIILVSSTVTLAQPASEVAQTLSCRSGLVGLGDSLNFKTSFSGDKVYLDAENADILASVVVAVGTSEGDVMELQIKSKTTVGGSVQSLPLIAQGKSAILIWEAELNGARTAYFLACEKR